jgi:hypothetical protein
MKSRSSLLEKCTCMYEGLHEWLYSVPKQCLCVSPWLEESPLDEHKIVPVVDLWLFLKRK